MNRKFEEMCHLLDQTSMTYPPMNFGYFMLISIICYSAFMSFAIGREQKFSFKQHVIWFFVSLLFIVVTSTSAWFFIMP